MKHAEIKLGMAVKDGRRIGEVIKIFTYSVHVRWTNHPNNETWIYDLGHLKFLEEVK